MIEMIDLHNHILPGLDDGAKTLDESIEMCRIGYQDGIRTIVATPHTLNGLYLNDRETILTKVQELNDVLMKLEMRNSEFGMNHLPSELRILPGADVHFSEDILNQLDQGKVTTVADGGKYISLEFPFQGIPYRAEEILFRIVTRGVNPIISHPERNFEIAERPQRYYEMIRMGCLGQVTAMSLTGGFGHGVRKVVERLIKKRLVHFVASDAHSVIGRRPILSEALKVAEGIVGGKEAKKMVTEYPQAILEGRRPNVPKPLSP
jgi:protein-tyrosine phosphatase